MLVEMQAQAQPSCRTDFSTHTIKTPTEDDVDELFGYAYGLAEHILQTGSPWKASRGRHYPFVYMHPSGVSLRCHRPATAPDSEHYTSTYGTAVVELSGKAWGSLDQLERNRVITDIRGWEGFFHTTRWDAQITILEPEVSAEEIVRQVEAGDLWAAGYNSAEHRGPRNRDRDLLSGATQYFGGKESRVRARLYDKAAEAGWDTPALRAEVQFRREPADQHFRRLAQRCLSEDGLEPLFLSAEQETVKAALSQHLDLRDTSKWAGKRKPKNWAQEAPKARWWTDALGEAHDPLAIDYKAAATLDKSIEQMAAQYGRKFVMWVIKESNRRDLQPSMVVLDFLGRCGSRLKDEDYGEVMKLCPGANAAKVKDFLDECATYGHWASEHEVPEQNEK